MKLKQLLITTLFFIFPFQLYADTIGVYLGAGVWNHAASGNVRDTGTVNFDLKNDLKLKDKQEGYFYIAVEHPIPLIPNFKFASTKMSQSGTGSINVSTTFNGQTFTAGNNVETTIILDSTDITAYYEILDNVVEVDIGLTARKISGKVRLNNTSLSVVGEQKIDQTIPLIYAALSFNLPAGITLNGEGNFIGVGGVSYTDLTLKVRYEIIDVLGVEGGVRSQNLSLNDTNNVSADLTFSGVFFGVFAHF